MKKTTTYLLFTFLMCLFYFKAYTQGEITTITGIGVAGYNGDNIAATTAKIATPWGVAVDTAGNVYIADFGNNRIRKINKTGIITSIAGTGIAGFTGDGGPATAARINGPYDVAVDGQANVYIADYFNNRIRKINKAGIITTIAGSASTVLGDGGPATNAFLSGPTGISVDPNSGSIYISADGRRVRIVNSSGIIKTFAGNSTPGFSGDGGPATAALLNNPISIVADGYGSVYITDQLNHRIRKVNSSGIITTIAGGAAGYSGDGGPASAARMHDPWGIALDSAGNIYIGDHSNHCVRKINAFGIITTIAGTGIPGYNGDNKPSNLAKLNTPWGIRSDSSGSVYIADGGNQRVRKIVIRNRPPVFAMGVSQYVTVCENSVTNPIDGLLTVIDSDYYQFETWTVITVPANGTVHLGAPQASTGNIVTPTGCTYSPTLGYSGSDSFTVRVFDDYNTDTIKIYVNVFPAPTPTAGSTKLCINSTLALSNSIPGGVWTSGNTGIAITDSFSGIVTGISAGTATITYSLPTYCNATIDLTVHPLPSAITGGTSTCIGSTSSLSSATTGGLWYSSNTSVATVSSSGLLTGISAATALITYRVFPSGCMTVATITVTPVFGPITGIMKLCGNTVTLSNAVTGGTWSSNNTSIAIVDPVSGIVSTGTSAGTTIITYAVSAGCYVVTPFTVYMPPVPITGVKGICTGTISTLSCASPGGAWNSSNTSVAVISSSGMLSGISPGTTSITYNIVLSGCFSTTTASVTISPSAILGTGKVCSGSSITFSNAVTGGTWSSSKTATATIDPYTGILSGSNAGTTTITYSMGAGCITTASATVLAFSRIIGAATICTGQTAKLSNSLSGGTWTSSNTGVATVGSVTAVVAGISTGTSMITYTLPGGCYDTQTATINSTPFPISGRSTLCAGESTTLGNVSIGGTWSSSNTAVITIDLITGVTNGLNPGIATITYSLGFGCSTTKALTVHALPSAITGATNVCIGSTISLSNIKAGGTWSSMSGTATAGLTTGIIGGGSAGTTVISYTLGTGCATTKIITIDTLPAAITGTLNICIGKTTTLSNATPAGTWTTLPGRITIDAATGFVTGITTGTTIVTYTAMSGCRTTTTFTVNATPDAIAGPPGICEGTSAILTDATTGGSWYSSDPSTATINTTTGYLSGVLTGSTTITYTSLSGCITTASVFIHPVKPITGVPVVCPGNTTLLNNIIGGGIWSSSNTANATISTTGLVTGVAAGTAAIEYITPAGCLSKINITINPWLSPGTITGVSTLCRGYVIALFDTAHGGVWSSTDPDVYVNAGAGTVRGISPGTAAISYGVTNSCGTAFTKYTVTIIPPPSGRVISGPDSVCAGTFIALHGSISGGTWSSLNTNLAVNSTSGMVTGITAGSATVTYQYVNICGLTLEYHGVQVNPLPKVGPIVGATNVCVGAITLLANAESGGTWMATNGNATVAAGITKGINAGNDTIIYTTTTSCGSADTSVEITINPMPDAGAITGAGSVCTGMANTLTNAVTGGIWSSSGPVSISTTGIVTGIAAGSAFITYEVTNMCGIDKAIIPFTVNPQPDAGSISGADKLCAGQTTTLTGTATGGIWSTTNTIIDTVSGGVVTGITAGTDTVLYTVTNVCGTAIAKHGITVNPLPDAGTISGNSALCAGTTLLLTNNIPDGIWSSNDTITTVDNGNVTALAAGIAAISYSVTNMCGTAVTSKNIEVMPLPVVADITGTSHVCEGVTISLTDAVIGGTWSSNNNISTVTNGVVTGIKSGIDNIVYSVTNSCGTATANKEISVEPQPYAGVITVPDSMCAGDTLTLSSSVANGVWTNTNKQIAKLIVPDGIVGLAKGIDTISYAIINSCGTAIASLPLKIRAAAECYPDTTTIHHNFDCTGNSELVIYPNPNPGVFTINVISDIQEVVYITIFNLVGQKVYEIELNTNSPREIDIKQPQGMYLLSASGDHGHCSRKLSVTR
ncbi:MAG: C-terminal target protein [Flavipsychrobacter sp.]|nr:C-terminal target protein [Flavipsychrobacter sp.]